MSPRHALLLVGLLALPACASRHRKASRLEGHYDTGSPGDAWEKVDPGGADYAWFSPDLAATIYADSNCGSRYDDRALDALADSVAFGMVMDEPLSQEARTIDGRDGLVRTADGTLDGVAFRLGVVVLKKDQCVYDLLLVSPRSRFDQAWDGFESVLAGFATRGR